MRGKCAALNKVCFCTFKRSLQNQPSRERFNILLITATIVAVYANQLLVSAT